MNETRHLPFALPLIRRKGPANCLTWQAIAICPQVEVGIREWNVAFERYCECAADGYTVISKESSFNGCATGGKPGGGR